MIRLLRDDGVEILINNILITGMDQVDGKTVLTLSDGEVIRVKNHPKDIVEKIRAFNIGIESDGQEDSEGGEKG